ncbi:cartilage intermediate layer protein 1-like [Branchiostoma floridae]|uniref:Cartilage intermediate layer protein 1-like n=1 Tax=Branchiostoma floridae TaxID=7739 RepID=A0A9J7LR19_BRAFL|nr:cartilage intermediate layer protein 1-like [Branchiostoma floridae]
MTTTKTSTAYVTTTTASAALSTAATTSAETTAGTMLEESVIGVRAETCTSWTAWLDRDDPGGTGDVESLTDLRRKNSGQICTEPVGIQARVRGSRMGALLTGQQFESFSPTKGFVCRNGEQNHGRCQDYEVRFCCATNNTCRTFSTDPSWTFTWNNPPASSPLTFKVRARSDAHIILSSRNYWVAKRYKIIIDEFGNTGYYIRKREGKLKTAEVTGNSAGKET